MSNTDTVRYVLAGFPEWPEVMTTWGNKMLAAVHTVSQMAAVGFGLPAGAFTERMNNGPHLLAPTGDIVFSPIMLSFAVTVKPGPCIVTHAVLHARLSLLDGKSTVLMTKTRQLAADISCVCSSCRC